MADLLVLEPDPTDPPCWFGDWLGAAGLDLHVVRPYAGDPVPAAVEADGLLVMGGRMGANDDADHPWLADVKALLRAYVADARPTLGICLGHQLLAVALGGTVVPDPDGERVGLVEVGLTAAAAGDALGGGLRPSARAVHWHHDVVSVPPPGAVPLAMDGARLQALRFGPAAWGVQFHPEVGREVTASWAAETIAADARTRSVAEAAAAAIAAADAELRATWRPFAERYADVVTARVPT